MACACISRLKCRCRMSHWLDYSTQVSELEKIARLEQTREMAPQELPGLGPVEHGAACLVCGARPARNCGACGCVCYCGLECQRADTRWHAAVCGILREIAEDARVSKRTCLEELVHELDRRAAAGSASRLPASWDEFWGPGRELAPGLRRRLTAQLTRPFTLARALAALAVPDRTAPAGVLRVHVMGASRREQEVAPLAWAEVLRWSFGARLELVLVGPDIEEARARVHRLEVSDARVELRALRGLYRRALWGELGRPDLVIGYDCGILRYPSWRATILDLRGSGVPFVITSYRRWEADAEARLLKAAKVDCLVEPQDNPFASLAADRSSTIANDVSFDNAYVSAWA